VYTVLDASISDFELRSVVPQSEWLDRNVLKLLGSPDCHLHPLHYSYILFTLFRDDHRRTGLGCAPRFSHSLPPTIRAISRHERWPKREAQSPEGRSAALRWDAAPVRGVGFHRKYQF